jgi:hypothetical protein
MGGAFDQLLPYILHRGVVTGENDALEVTWAGE